MNATYVKVSGWVAAVIVTIAFVDSLVATYRVHYPWAITPTH